MSDLEDSDDRSNKEAPQEAENYFEDVEFDFNISNDDDIQKIINHRESKNDSKSHQSNKDGEPAVPKMSDGELKANWSMSNENEVAKVAKPSDMEPKCQNKHNVDRVMPNENEESSIIKPSELKHWTETNLYSTQVSGTSISASSHKIEYFLGVHILMGIMKLPVYDMYWAAETRYPKIADVMSNKRCKQLRKYI